MAELNFWQKLLLKLLKDHIPDTPVDPGIPDPPVVTPTPDAKSLTPGVDYDYAASDSPGHLGQWYFYPSAHFPWADIEKVLVGNVHYRFTREYKRSALWYGAPSQGNIIVTLKDGTVYETEQPAQPTPGTNKEYGGYHGRHNGDRPLWYFTKKMSAYPRTFTLYCKECGYHGITITNNGKRFDVNGILFKQSDVSGRGMALHLPSHCKATEAYIEF